MNSRPHITGIFTILDAFEKEPKKLKQTALRDLSESAMSGLQAHFMQSPAGTLAQPRQRGLAAWQKHSAEPSPGKVLSGIAKGFVATRVKIKGASNYLENSVPQNVPGNPSLPWRPSIKQC